MKRSPLVNPEEPEEPKKITFEGPVLDASRITSNTLDASHFTISPPGSATVSIDGDGVVHIYHGADAESAPTRVSVDDDGDIHVHHGAEAEPEPDLDVSAWKRLNPFRKRKS